MGQLDQGPRTEQYQLIYEQPIYPKNLYLERAPYTHAEYRREVIDRRCAQLQERGIYAPVEAAPATPVAPEPDPVALDPPPDVVTESA